jgi:hypothetical protein
MSFFIKRIITPSVAAMLVVLVLGLRTETLSTCFADTDNGTGAGEEDIWGLEEAYFASLYKADYSAVLAIVHSQFLGWPGTLPQPIDKDGSASFMKQLIPAPTSCVFKIERGGIRMMGEVALTQYTINVDRGDATSAAKTQSSRITHTWVKELGRWKLLGGMSYDQK